MRRGQIAEQVLERQPGVDDVLDDQDVAPLDRRVEVLEDPHDPGGLGRRAVGGHGHEVDLDGDLERPHQVREEEHGALEDANEHQIAADIVPRDLGRELADALRQPVLGYEDLADPVVVAHFLILGARAERARVVWLSNLNDSPHDDRPNAVGEVERGVAAERRDLVSAARGPRRRAAHGLVGEPLDDEPAERGRKLAQSLELDFGAAAERLRHEGVEHLGLVAQNRRERQDVVLGGGMDLSQGRNEPGSDPRARVRV